MLVLEYVYQMKRKEIKMATIKSGNHIFEIVESVPAGYSIWNIGKNMIDGYLPLCEDAGNYNVNTDTLKAIKIEGAQTILAAAGFSKTTNTVNGMEAYIKRNRNAKGAWARYKRDKMMAALPILKNVKFD